MSEMPEINSYSSTRPIRWAEGDPNELLTLNVALLLPPQIRSESLKRSRHFAILMQQAGLDSQFVLGESVPWGSERAEPHTSIFMLSVPRTMIPRLASALDRVAMSISPVDVVGERYAHNPFGAPEIYFRRTPQWHVLQGAVVTAFEPFREGRVRPTGPFGEPLRAMLAGAVAAEPERLQQLRQTGYDEIGGRFNPHITEAAPTDPSFHVSFDTSPEPASVAGTLTTLALYRMGPYGTCLTNYHRAELHGPPRVIDHRRDDH
ncbi:hypothetical protein [Nocardia tengchongensis]|uniref:hypothetical protein n=1 Tax=Nocardia tengchongensis TaxID=2055889 RepID=UPI00369C0846